VGDVVSTMTMGMCQTAGSTVGAPCDTAHKADPICYGDLGLVCIPSNGTIGTCQKIELLGAGATCGTIGTPETAFAQCSAGGLCMKASSTDKTGTCVEPAADGAACNSDAAIGPPCLAPAKCVVPAGGTGTAGTCTFPNPTQCM
jgi:hypothetical protein